MSENAKQVICHELCGFSSYKLWSFADDLKEFGILSEQQVNFVDYLGMQPSKQEITIQERVELLNILIDAVMNHNAIIDQYNGNSFMRVDRNQ